MKSTVCIICLILDLNSCFSQIHSVSSFDGKIVIAAGKNGIILRSIDSGINWNSNLTGNSDLYSVCCSGQNAFCAGDNGSYMRSSDFGVNWTIEYIADGTNLRSVFFTNSQTGWICGENGLIIKTTNGGFGWIAQTSNISSQLNSIRFLNSNTGVVCGSGGVVLKTVNGGTNWIVSTTQLTDELISIDIKNNTVIAVGKNSAVIKSSDFGATWNKIDYKIITKSGVNGIYMQDENNHFTCGGGGFIRRTTNGGNTFTFPVNPMFGDLYSIYFYNNNTGWAVSRKTYAIIRTSDGGNTWNLPAGTNVSYSWNRVLAYNNAQSYGDIISTSYNAINRDVLYTLVSNTLYRSSDIGNSWNAMGTVPTGSLSQVLIVSPRDSSKMLALIQNPGKVYYTSNYGATWDLTFYSSFQNIGVPLKCDPNHPDTVYVLAFHTLYKSTNFGLNWSTFSVAPFNEACDIEIQFGNSNSMVVSSAHTAKVYTSTNGGLNFTMTNSDTSSYIYSESPSIAVSSLDSNVYYHLFYGDGSLNGIWKSTNNGINWLRISNIYLPWGLYIANDDPNVLAVGAWDGVARPFYLSSNGGISFIQTDIIPNGQSGNVAVFAYDRGNILIQQTNGIYKLSVRYDVPAIGIQPISGDVPKQFLLKQNYPNPFNPSTKIKFSIISAENISDRSVQLIIYDLLGKEVASLVNQNLQPGNYEVEWNASDFPSGVYYYKLTAGDFIETKKMVLVK